MPTRGGATIRPRCPRPKRSQQIHRPGADGICLWIFQHDSALWKLRREFIEVRRLRPLLRRLAFDGRNLVEALKNFSRWTGNRTMPTAS